MDIKLSIKPSSDLSNYEGKICMVAVNDDNDLLNHVSDSMRVGGKQSKDRFIFVVNKLDDFRKGEDSVVSAIEKVRKYLEEENSYTDFHLTDTKDIQKELDERRAAKNNLIADQNVI